VFRSSLEQFYFQAATVKAQLKWLLSTCCQYWTAELV